MRKVELKIHPGKIYEVHEKEFSDLTHLGMVARIIEDAPVEPARKVEPLQVNVIETPGDSSEEDTPETSLADSSASRKKRTYKRKTSPTTDEESE